MSEFIDLKLLVVKKNSVVSVASEEKLRSEHSQIFSFISSEVKQRSECSQSRKTAY